MNKGIETWLVCRTQSTNDPAVICLRMKYFLPHLKKALQPQNRRKKAFAINPSSKSPLQMKKYFKFHLDLFFFLKKGISVYIYNVGIIQYFKSNYSCIRLLNNVSF